MVKEHIGTRIKIITMVGEPQYTNKEGVITYIGKDCYGETYYSGTWGGCNIYPQKDTIEILSY